MAVRDILRIKGTPYKDLGLDDPGLSDTQLIDAMLAHPILINRPFVTTPRGTRLCRPSDAVIELLDHVPDKDLFKEEGEPFVVRRLISGNNQEFQKALRDEGLPTDDLSEPNRSFFVFQTLTGTLLGYGGFERYNDDVLVRSLVVPLERRGKGIGRSLLAVLLRDAFDAGARTAWLLTPTAADFFVKAGFKRVDRESAPAPILVTRQATVLCPTSAALLTRAISL
jgi:arsenate reductase